ncbi:MAG: InlB B-repeat-containing protein, partial [Bacilli bacterium]
MKRGLIKVTFVIVLILGLFLSFSCTTNNECYDVTIDLAGGTADNELNYRCLPGTKLLLFTPEKEGYDFVGWQYGDKVITSDILEINESLVLTALWEIKTFYITLDLDGGSCESTKIPIRYQELIELPTPTKPGFKFMGWYESDHLFVDKTYNRTTNLTVRAKWESLDYTIALMKDDSIYQTISIKYNDELVLPKLQKDGYTFMGWSLNGNIFEDDIFQFEENIVLDAVWMPNTYKITLKDETTTEIEITYGDTINLPVLSKTGYKFLGWYLDDNLFTESKWIRLDDIILVAKWEKIAYEIKLIDDEITTIKIFYGDVINITTPSKCGYNFLGWYEDDLLFTDTIWNRCENITLKARYEKIVYTITLKDDETKTIKIKIDNEINLPSLEKTGFSFLGWYNGDELFTDTIWNRYEDLTLVARWEEVSNKELINQFNILCYNTQNSDYDQL